MKNPKLSAGTAFSWAMVTTSKTVERKTIFSSIPPGNYQQLHKNSSTSQPPPSRKQSVVRNHKSSSEGARVVSTYFQGCCSNCIRVWTDSVPSCSEISENYTKLNSKASPDPLDSPLKWNLERTRSCSCKALECYDRPSQGMVQALIEHWNCTCEVVRGSPLLLATGCRSGGRWITALRGSHHLGDEWVGLFVAQGPHHFASECCKVIN